MTPNSPCWYQNGVYGQLGFGTPYISTTDRSNWYSNNSGILKLVDRFGKLLFGIMTQPDVWKTTPPQTSYFPQTVGKAIEAFDATIRGNMVLENKPDVRVMTDGADPQPFIIYPIPYFRVRNSWAKQWATYGFKGLRTAMKHPNNLDSLQINQDFCSNVSVFTNLIKQELCIEMLGIKPEEIEAAGGISKFTITDAHYAAYSPSTAFNQVERTDTGAPLNFMLSPDDLAPIVEGIPVPMLVPLLTTWPVKYQPPVDISNVALGSQGNAPPAGEVQGATDGTKTAATVSVTSTVVPAPGP